MMDNKNKITVSTLRHASRNSFVHRVYQHGVILGSVAINGHTPSYTNREERKMETYVGLDVSLKNTSVCVVDRQGTVVKEGVVVSERLKR